MRAQRSKIVPYLAFAVYNVTAPPSEWNILQSVAVHSLLPIILAFLHTIVYASERASKHKRAFLFLSCR